MNTLNVPSGRPLENAMVRCVRELSTFHRSCTVPHGFDKRRLSPANPVNPKYMKKSCAPACKSCDYLSIEGRCPLDPEAPDAWSAGDLNAMFVRLTNEPYLSLYETKILSSPEMNGGPWVITMENVVSELEANSLIELGAIEGYERSSDVGDLKADGTFDSHVNSGRTSFNAWCLNDCYKNETALAVVNRLSQITGINETNSENLQMLRYEEGQHYQVHHDYIAHHIRR